MRKAGLEAEDELQWARARLDCDGRASEFNVVDDMWNARVTSHVPLREVADRLTVGGIVEAIMLADRTMRSAGLKRPRIAVAAVNPHAGEGGEIGTEEIEVIEPAARQAQSRQIAVEGPFPSDTLYVRMRDRLFDCAVSMYHDQGQIAIKLLGFDQGVTVLGGLPVSDCHPGPWHRIRYRGHQHCPPGPGAQCLPDGLRHGGEARGQRRPIEPERR